MEGINIQNSQPNSKNSISKEKPIIKTASLPLKLKNHFVTEKKPKASEKSTFEIGFEHDQDVKTDEEFYQKIFSNNLYNPTSENLIDYYLEIRRMMDIVNEGDTGNVGTVVGMTVFGLFGFLGFSFTIIGGIAAGVLGGTIGRYAGKKLRRKMKKSGPLSQEEIYRTKVECMTKVGKLQKDILKHNLNKFRILIEKIIEESMHAFNLDLFEDQKKMAQAVVKFRDFMVSLLPQKAILLSYKLFKIHLKQQDLENPESLEETASKLHKVFIPYIQLIEVNENANSKTIKKLSNLVTYQKIKKLLTKPEIIKILDLYPDPRQDLEYLERFRELMKQKVDLQQLNAQAEAGIQQMEIDKSSQIVEPQIDDNSASVLKGSNPKAKSPENLQKSVESMESIEFEEGNSKRYMPYVNVFEATKSRVLTTNPDRLKTSGVAARFFVSPILAPDSSVAKVESLEIDKYNEDSSETSSVNKEKELEALEDEQKLANDSALYNNNEVSLQDHSRSAEKNKKNVKKMEEKKLECPIKLTCDKLKNNILKCEKDEKQLSNRSKKIGSPMKRQTQYLENVEVDCDPTRTIKKPDIVKMNSFSDLLALEEENKIEEVVEEVKKDTKRHESHHSNQISKENDAKFSSAVLKQNQNKTKKEIVFEKIIHIAYDNESKWDKVMQNEQITIHKIKPENSPVVLLRAWATIRGQTPREIFDQIFDAESRNKWDTVLAGFRVVEQMDEETDCIHFIIKTPFGITERDFLQKRQFQHDYPEKGTSIISFQSTTHPSVPPAKNRVRGETHIAGYIIKPAEDDPNSTTLCILTQVDIKGNIPKAIVNMFAGKAPADWLQKLKKACLAKKK